MQTPQNVNVGQKQNLTTMKRNKTMPNLTKLLRPLLVLTALVLLSPSAIKANSYVFALNTTDAHTYASHYYGDYDKGEPTKAHTDKYAKVTASRNDWSGTYLFVGQTTTSAYYGFTGTTFSSTATDAAINVTNYSNHISGQNNSATLITSPEGVIEMKIELVGNAKDLNSKGINYYRISYVSGNKTQYIGCTANTTNTMTTTSTKPTNLTDQAQYLWQIKDGALMTNGTVVIINKKWSSDNLGFWLTSSYKALSNYAGNITSNASNTGWSQIHLYEKEPDYTVTYDANGGSGSMSDESNPYTSGNIVTILENSFTPPHPQMAFLKWNTAADGTGVSYNEGETFAISGNTTLYAQWTNIHNITIAPTTHGSVTTDPYPSINAGMPVDITATPEAGHVLESLRVTDEDGNNIALHNRRFIMPDSDVTVTAIFRTPTGQYIKRTNMDEDSWAGTYRLGFYEGGGGDYAFNATTISSGNSSGVPATYSANHDTLMGGIIVTVEYGGRWQSGELSSDNSYYNDSSYYHMYYEDASGKKMYINGGSGTLTFTNVSTTPTNKTYRWFFYTYNGNFLIKNFYAAYFFKAINAGNNHWVNIGTGDVPAGPTSYVPLYLYKYDIPTYRINVVGDTENAGFSMNTSHSVIPDRDGCYAVYADSTVSFTVKPKVGYEVSSVSYVTANGIKHTLSTSTIHATEQQTFNFDMPAEAITIYINTNKEGEDNSDCVTEGTYNTSNVKYGSSIGAYSPYNADTKYSFHQILYSDENIPKYINSIGFMYFVNNTSVNITHKNDVRVYMLDTTATSLTSYMDTANMTRVYAGSMNFTHPNNNQWEWTDFDFNQNGGLFEHNPDKNLIVLIFDNSGVGDEYFNRGFFYSTSANNIHQYASGTYGFMYNDSRELYYKNSTGGQGNAVAVTQNKKFPLTHFCGPTTYTVTCATGLEGGEISALPNSGLFGDGTETVTITAVPEEDYKVGTITATNETTSETIALSGSDNTRTFIMPAANVSVTATFTKAGGGDTWVDNVSSQPAGYAVDGSGDVTISSNEGLAWLISVVNGLNGQTADDLIGKNITLSADLDMNEYVWVPIGTADKPFGGIFNGGNHSISGLHINDADEATAAGNPANTGLFGCTASDATVKNIYIKNATFYAQTENLGGVVGTNAGTVQNCYSDATLSGTATTGGLVGTNSGTLSHSYTMVTSGTTGSNSGTVTNSYYKAATDNSPATGEFTTAVAYTYGDHTTNNAVSNGTTTKPLVDWLNTDNPDATVKWLRAKGSSTINGGYPVLVNANSDTIMAVVGISGDNNVYCGNANEMITTHGTNSNADIYIYSNGTITFALGAAHLFIDENASIKQGGDIANADITATVGITIDNSANNGEMKRDWHTFATPLHGAPLGITYINETAYTQDVVMHEGTHFTINTNDNSYFDSGLTNNADQGLDLYLFYEPEYHWLNLKRNRNSHWHEDAPSEGLDFDPGQNLTEGRGYLIALGDDTDALKEIYLSARGTLTRSNFNISITSNGTHLTGYNLLGNPYHSYLDFNEFANVNKNSIWGDVGYKAYIIYNADNNRFEEYLVDENGVSFSQHAALTTTRYIHPHQGFFVVKKTSGDSQVTFTNAMRSITGTSTFRDVQPTYPLVNLFCTDSDGKKEVSVIEFNRPEMSGSLKMKEMLNSKGDLYIRWDGEDFGSMFLDHTPSVLPVWFKAAEQGVFTLSWNTANATFGHLHIIDNLTGADIDCLSTDSYTFESRPSDSKARFRLVMNPLGIEEDESETAQEENFAFFNGNELVVTGKGELTLTNLNGQVLATETLDGEQNHISLPKTTAGMYLLRLTNAKNVKIQKIVICK